MPVHPPSEQELLDLVGSIYESALGTAGMTQALHAVSRGVQAAFAQMLTVHRPTGRLLQSLIGEASPAVDAAHREYLEDWSALDPRLPWLASLAAGEVARCHEHFDDRFVGGNRFYQHHLIARGFRWGLAGAIDNGPDSCTVMLCVRSAEAPPFEDRAAAALRRLLPHVRTAWRIRSRFDHQAPSAGSALQLLRALPMPCVFTDGAGRCIERNGAFDELLDPLGMRVSVGRVRFADGQAQSAWEAALSDTHATALEHSFAAGAPGAGHWLVHLIPLQWRLLGGDALDSNMILAVFVPKAAPAQPAARALPSAARLTQAELEVATSLLHGLPAKVIARQRGASVNTVRSQIMAILEKTGFKSQRELIAAVGTSTLGAGAFGSTLSRSTRPTPPPRSAR